MDMPPSLSLQKLPLSSSTQTLIVKKDWNSLIRQHAKLKNDHAILSTYTQMESQGVAPDNGSLPLILKACARLNAVEKGRKIHSSVMGTNLMEDVRVGTALVDFHCKCGFVDDARGLFDRMSEKDVVLWNAMMSGYVACGYYEEAILLFLEMQKEGFEPNSRTVVALLRACGEVLDLQLGQELHGYCLRNGLFDLDPHVGTALIGFYLRFDVIVSRVVFDLMAVRNTVSWNAIITGYFDVEQSLQALELFVQMVRDGVKFDSVTVLLAIQACADFGSLELGMQIHQMVIKYDYSDDLFIVNALLSMYREIGSLELASKLFDNLTTHDVALWNSMIAAYIECGCYEEAISLFVRMRTEGIREDERTFVIMLSLCAELTQGLRMGQNLHAHASKSRIKMDVSLGNALLIMYADLYCVEAAQKVFDEMSDVDVISYNTLILAMARSKWRDEVWELFAMMRESEVEPNSYTIISLLAACEDDSCLNVGRSIHGFVIKHGIEINPSLNTALTDMYMNCGSEATARTLFEGYANRDLVSWNALIACYIKNSQALEALFLFRRMISEEEPNSVTIINVLSSCTSLANLPVGQCLHAYVTRRGSSFGFNLSLANALVTMYARCGSMQNAEKIFKALPRRNIISWNAMITGYGMHGLGCDAIVAFLQMLEDGFQPNGVTFVSILSACRHSGLIEKGLQLFYSMVQDFNLIPELAHYGCVVDLLGRAGRLNEAKEFIRLMPIEPDGSVWRALLSACRIHFDIKVAETVFENLVELEPTNAGNFVLLSNIYAASGFWSEVRQIRAWLREMGLRKPPGISWIVIRDQVHSFTAGDTSHPESDKIYANLNCLLSLLKETGYVPDFHWSFYYEED